MSSRTSLLSSSLAALLALSACANQPADDEVMLSETEATATVEPVKAVRNAPYVDGQLIVRFKDGLGRDQMVGLVSRNGDTVLRYSIGSTGAMLIEISSGTSVMDAVHLYTELPQVEYAEPNYVRDETGGEDR